MFYIRISKYPSDKRDESGRYLANDWTAVSDIGNQYRGEVLTPDLYLSCEKSYVEVIAEIVSLQGIASFLVSELERNEPPQSLAIDTSNDDLLYSTIRTDMIIPAEQIPSVTRLALRELIWCKLINPHMFIHFGYDMYVYVGCEIDPFILQDMAREKNIFIESYKSPYL